ncbi:MAG TPA: hypothetical protein VN229_06320 [Terriglobales bacterium]|nr:hypothetical protein [Terriglobales bacterium]
MAATLRLGYLEAIQKVEQRAALYFLFWLVLAIVEASLLIFASGGRGGQVTAENSAIILLNTLFICSLSLGRQADRWRTAALERHAEGDEPEALVCHSSRFLLCWSVITSACFVLVGALLIKQFLFAEASTWAGWLPEIQFISVLIWALTPVVFYLMGRRELVLTGDGLRLPRRDFWVPWSDLAGYELQRNDTLLSLRLELTGEAGKANARLVSRQWLNPSALTDREVLLTISGYDKSERAIYDFIKDHWWRRRDTASSA